jgi:AcrR family transcriptional regulator
MQSEGKRQQILDAAHRLFVRQGFESTTTDAIAAQAGVSKQTLYRYYRSKDELLVAVMRAMTVDQLFPTAAVKLPANASHGRLASQLVALASAIMARILQAEYLDLVRLVFAECGRRPELAELFRAAVPQSGGEQIRELLVQGQARGLVRPDVDLALAVRLFAGALLTWLMGEGLLDPRPVPRAPTTRTLHRLVRIFLDGVAV